ncbi:hypothetical protein AE937_11495 [Bacteroides fragilis]|uniref:Uncharacterized protein n=1 Tax=Bacteroides fragilis TaxID=817 RepID=A0A413JTZ8_BACFG|nr:hypothetical protein [Bacteroides fragilis]RGY65046.1 hypothetical protein DXA27_20825 [Bacteroides fragilis]
MLKAHFAIISLPPKKTRHVLPKHMKAVIVTDKNFLSSFSRAKSANYDSFAIQAQRSFKINKMYRHKVALRLLS